MEIMLIGDFSENFDEGMKNIAKYVYKYLSKKHNVKSLNVKHLISRQTLENLKKNNPDIIHYFTGPTFGSFILLKMLSIRWPESKIIISALHPNSASFLKNKVLRLIAKSILTPDVILYQSNPELFRDIAKTTVFFPNGVDIHKFRPVTKKEKIRLRNKYDIDEDKLVVLHVGHLSKRRNLQLLARLQKTFNDIQVVVVGSTYVDKDQAIYRELIESGCKVIEGYVPNVEELYALSDCYVFPVKWGDSINIPLSVLEAMSCNLPVISFKYPALSIFEEGNGLYFVENEYELLKKVEEVKDLLSHNKIEIKTREKVLSYSWENLVKRLEDLYFRLLEEKRGK